MIRPMTLLFAVLPGFSAVPCAGQEPTYLVDFTVSLNGKKILEGSKDIRTGSYAEETITRVFSSCPFKPRTSLASADYDAICRQTIRSNL